MLNVSELPIMLHVKRAVEVSGFARTEIYERLSDGRLRGKKMRKATFVLTESLLANIAELQDY